MKKVIDHKTYNTETARVIGKWDNGYLANDLYYCEETLLKTRKGSFFLYGFGGAGSKYNRRINDNSWCCGEVIKPLTAEDAQKWTEENCSIDAKYFVCEEA